MYTAHFFITSLLSLSSRWFSVGFFSVMRPTKTLLPISVLVGERQIAVLASFSCLSVGLYYYLLKEGKRG